MPYSQKYCLVSFLQPMSDGAEFAMTDWPMHVTLADVFAVDLPKTGVEAKLGSLLKDFSAITTRAVSEVTLGTTKVMLLEKSRELQNLHNCVIDLLQSEGAKFNTPQYTREGFLPHCTIQRHARLRAGDEAVLDNVTLIDMFPHEDWRQRRVVGVFRLGEEPTE